MKCQGRFPPNSLAPVFDMQSLALPATLNALAHRCVKIVSHRHHDSVHELEVLAKFGRTFCVIRGLSMYGLTYRSVSRAHSECATPVMIWDNPLAKWLTSQE
jgi:hypothetical protein